MKYRLLEVASGTQPLHLHLAEEISAFEDLRRDGLVAGTLLAPADAIIHSLTPDGRALLALRRCRLARQAGGSQGS